MKILYKILGGILVLAIFFAFLFSLYKGDIEKSNLTDWISAFCNLAMAAAALGGYLIAKDWKRHAVKDKVLNLALDMKTAYAHEIFENLTDLNVIYSKIKKLADLNVNYDLNVNAFNKTLRELISKCDVHNNHLKNNMYAFNKSHAQIQSLGYDFKDGLSYSVQDIIVNVIEANTCSNILIIHLNDLLDVVAEQSSCDGLKIKDMHIHMNAIMTSSPIDTLPNLLNGGIERLYEYHVSTKGSVFNDLRYIG